MLSLRYVAVCAALIATSISFPRVTNAQMSSAPFTVPILPCSSGVACGFGEESESEGSQTSVGTPRIIRFNQPQNLKFGSIAVSRNTGKRGWAWGYSSKQAAKNAAMRDCGSSDCKSMSFGSAYGALVESSDGWNANSGSTQRQAEQNALRRCQKKSSQPNACRLINVLNSDIGLINTP
jgi:hypothetical protein